MTLTILIPTGVLFQGKVRRIAAETPNGRYTLLPRHIDFIAGLVPGILEYEPESEKPVLLAADEGMLVKRESGVWISLRRAVRGGELGSLHQTVDRHYRELDREERKNRTAVARLERDMAQRIYELEKNK